MTVTKVAKESITHGERATRHGLSTLRPSDRNLQRAQGAVHLELAGSAYGSRILGVYQKSPLRILFPRMRGGALDEAVLVNTGGGIAGGDRLDTTVTVVADASVTVTSQAAERVYRALDEPARITTRLKVDSTSKLAWMPQETIVFNGARLRRSTEIEVCSGAEMLALEWLVLGRAAHGEAMTVGEIHDRWRITNGARLAWADSFRANDEVLPRLGSRSLLGDLTAIATLIYFGPDIGALLEFLREPHAAVKCRYAATVVSGLLIARFGAESAMDLKDGLRAILTEFNELRRSCLFRPPKMWSR